SSVVGLGKLRCPAAVAGLIVAVYFLAFQSVLCGWPLAHVANEIGERLQPAAAHTNPASAVILEMTTLLICASLLHRLPDIPFGRSKAAVPKIAFVGPTPARRLWPIEQVVRSDHKQLAAL